MEFTELYLLLEDRKYQEFQNNYNKIKVNLDQFQVKILEITHNVKKGKFEEAKKVIATILENSEKYTEFQQTAAKIKLVSFTSLIGEIDASESLISQIDPFIKKFEHSTVFEKLLLSDYYNYKGIHHLIIYELDKSLESFEMAQDIDKNLPFDSKLAKTLSNYALTYQTKGDLAPALALMFEAKDIQLKNNDIHSLAQTYGNISESMMLKGEYQIAFQYSVKAHEIFSDLGSLDEIATNLSNQARISNVFSNFETVDLLYTNSLALRRKDKSSIILNYSESLLEYIEFRLQHNKDITPYLEELETIVKKVDEKSVLLRLEIAKALVMYHSDKLLEKLDAISKFELLEKEISGQDFRAMEIVLDYFIDGLLLQYRATENNNLIKIMKLYLNKYLSWSKEQNAILGEIKGLILRAQIEIYQQNHEKSVETLQEIIQISYNKGIPHLFSFSSSLLRSIQQFYSQQHNKLLKLDIIKSFLNLLTNVPETMVEDNTIHSVFLLTNTFEKINLYQTSTSSIDLRPYLDLLKLDNELFVNYQDEAAIVILKSNKFSLGISFQGNVKSMAHKLEVLFDGLSLKYNLEELSEIELLEISKNKEFLNYVNHFLIDGESELETDIIYPTMTNSSIKQFDIFLHPVRLSIMSYLLRNFQLIRSELINLVGGGSTTISRNIKKLDEEHLIKTELDLIDGRPQQIIHITQEGINSFTKFRKLFADT